MVIKEKLNLLKRVCKMKDDRLVKIIMNC